MTSRLTGIAKRDTPIFAILAVLTLCSLSQAALAQDPIRVETNEVLVPVGVIDKERFRLLGKDPSLWRTAEEGDIQLREDILEGVAIRDLTATDFHVFDDGREQAIRNVTYGRSLYWNFHDNMGYHTERFGEGGGIWTVNDWPPGLVGDIDLPGYLIAYERPESPEGSCHQIKVKANRPNAFVIARGEYCNSKDSASYTMSGINFVKQMEKDWAQAKASKVDLAITAVTMYTESDAARVHIALDWPWKSLKHKDMTVGLLGAVSRKDGSLAARFSDLFESYSKERDFEFMGTYHTTDTTDAPTRYERQLKLPPGEYAIRVMVSDGTKLGRTEVPLTVDNDDRKELAMSTVAICKRIQDVSAFSSQAQAKLL
jgi:hypothetical protein